MDEPLTVKESEVMRGISKGWTNLHIAQTMGVTVKCVENHINHSYDKLGVPVDTIYHRRILAILLWRGR